MNPLKDAVVICIDEDGSLSIRSYFGSTWAKSGYPKRIRVTYHRNEVAVQIVAAFNPHDGTGFAKCYDAKNFETILEFLTEVERQYPQTKVHIIWDNFFTNKEAERIWNIYNSESLFSFHYTLSNAS